MHKQEVTFEGQYVFVSSEGDKNMTNAKLLWTEIARVCNESHCFKVLGVSHSENPFSITESFQFAELFKALGITNTFKVAWVETNPKAQNTLNLVENVLHRRGLIEGRMFRDINQAKIWLLKS
ncbi:MAG TPA: hypothetical protein ENJ60_15850 [Aeromonadales bacterium]|nr:hypothetical protein [Aeromonadales bacterium]